jgi:hypothetical protein
MKMKMKEETTVRGWVGKKTKQELREGRRM